MATGTNTFRALRNGLLMLGIVLMTGMTTAPAIVSAGTLCGAGTPSSHPPAVKTEIDFGCRNKGNSIMDMLFGIIRALSNGVGLIIVGSFIWAGIQYSASRGDPQNTAKAIGRMQATVVALLIYIFSYAFLNYIIPGAVLK